MPDPRDLTSVLTAAEAAAEAGDFPAAEQRLREAATLQEARLGSLHPDLANTLNNLAIVCEKVDKSDEAERHYRRAFSIANSVLPPDHPFVATSRTNLKEFCDAKGRPFELPAPARPAAAAKPAQAAAPPPAPNVEARPAPSLAAAAAKPKTPPAPPPVKAKGGQASRAKAAAAVPAPTNGESKGGRRSGPPTAPTEAPRVEAARSQSLGPVAIGLALVGVIVLVTIVASRPQTPSATPADSTAQATIANSAPPTSPPPATASPAKGGAPPADRAAAPKPPPVASSGAAAAVIVNAGLCKRIETGVDWECDKVSSPVDAGTLHFYTRVRSPRDTTVQHRWYRGTELVRSVDLRIKANLGSGYRTYSRFSVDRGPGEWRVEVRAADGSVLREERFTVR